MLGLVELLVVLLLGLGLAVVELRSLRKGRRKDAQPNDPPEPPS